MVTEANAWNEGITSTVILNIVGSTERFKAGKIKFNFLTSYLKHTYITIYCISAQTGHLERDVTNHLKVL